MTIGYVESDLPRGALVICTGNDGLSRSDEFMISLIVSSELCLLVFI